MSLLGEFAWLMFVPMAWWAMGNPEVMVLWCVVILVVAMSWRKAGMKRSQLGVGEQADPMAARIVGSE